MRALASARVVLAGALAWAAAGALGGCGGEPASAEDARERIVATLPPLAWPARALLGERADVTVLLPPGASPHGFELSPTDAAALRGADLVLGAGGADEGALRGAGEANRVLLMRDAPGADDHHPWLDWERMAAFLDLAAAELAPEGERAAALSRASGEMAPAVEARRAAATAAEGLDVLVVTGHDAWSRFFGGIGIDDVMAVRRGHAGEPAASTLVEVRERAATADAVLVVLEPGENLAWLERLAEEVGGAAATLDPVGTRDWPGDMTRRYEAVAAALESLR